MPGRRFLRSPRGSRVRRRRVPGMDARRRPIPDLTVVGDLAVTVVFDVDAGGNLDVYTAGEGLAEACALFGPGGNAAGGLRPACTLPGATPTGAHPAPAPRRPTMRPARPRRAATWRPWSTGSTGSGDRSGP